MKIPKYIEFHNDTNRVLSRFLKAAEPEEGCALIIGHKNNSATNKKNNIWEIKHIWKCRNIWGHEESKLIHLNTYAFHNKKNTELSKKNFFEIDPRDYIAAQKWSRENDLEVLCCAHSHPAGDNKPSKMDLNLHHSPGLMIISDNNQNLKAWWIKNKFSFHRVKIEIFSLT
tara:strand:- start:419 stop:931 length:513 start_codon:yes stop_codon:yes gene_type:complete